MCTTQAEAEAMGRELLASQVTNFSINETRFVTNLYEAFLQRGPDSSGMAFWVSNAGTNNATQRQNVLNAFATSGSFRDLAGTLYREVFWLVADQLGTPRMVVDKSGSLASVKRHDYLPFGEEIGGAQVGLIGGRATTPGYVGDSVRQKFTGYESDGETGLNYAQARYQSSVQGRFTSVDPLGRSATITNPQSFNRYSYVLNTPLTAVDPTGMALSDIGVYQTNDPEDAQKAEHLSLRELQVAVDDEYASRSGGTVDYIENRASYSSRAFNEAVAAGAFSNAYETQVRVQQVALLESAKEDAPIVATGSPDPFDYSEPPTRYNLNINQAEIDPAGVFTVSITLKAMSEGVIRDKLNAGFPIA